MSQSRGSLLLEAMVFHGFVPFLFLGVRVETGGVEAGVAGVASQELNADRVVEQVSVILLKLQINSFNLDL